MPTKNITEDITKSDINNAISNKLDSDEFKRKVRNICADVLSDLYKTLWYKKSFWKGDVSK